MGALLPLGALALAIPLGLLALTLPVTTTVVGGRKRREAAGNGTTLAERQAELLTSYIHLHGIQHNFGLQREMIARYLECDGGAGKDGGNSPVVSACLEKLMCTFNDRKINLSEGDREVAEIILETIMTNEFISKVYKKRLEAAASVGRNYPGACHKFACDQEIFYNARY